MIILLTIILIFLVLIFSGYYDEELIESAALLFYGIACSILVFIIMTIYYNDNEEWIPQKNMNIEYKTTIHNCDTTIYIKVNKK